MTKLPNYLKHLKFRNPDDRNKSLFGYFHDTDLNMYEWLQINPEKMTIFNAYHEANARLWERNLQANLEHLLAPNSYNDIFGDLDRSHKKILFVDVGGGRGQSLKIFRKHMPGLKGRMIVQDLPKVIEDQTCEHGVEAMAHNFFSHQPVQGMNSRLGAILLPPFFFSHWKFGTFPLKF